MQLAGVEFKMKLDINSAAQTDRGLRRKSNEDTVFHRSGHTVKGKKAGLYLVCDGLGGHQAGEVASHLAVKIVTARLEQMLFAPPSGTPNGQTPVSTVAWPDHIEAAINQANAEIRSYAQTHAQKGRARPGTTLTLALIEGDQVQIANVGDSRTYIWRAGQVTQTTRDHSWAARLVRLGVIGEDEIVQNNWAHRLTQSLGPKERIVVDFSRWDLEPGDKMLLCSDGLWQAFPDNSDLAAWLGSEAEPTELCRQLVTEAKQRDGSDNISAVVVTVNECG
jgi:serine/threonine protein phosphatase PrpC